MQENENIKKLQISLFLLENKKVKFLWNYILNFIHGPETMTFFTVLSKLRKMFADLSVQNGAFSKIINDTRKLETDQYSCYDVYCL